MSSSNEIKVYAFGELPTGTQLVLKSKYDELKLAADKLVAVLEHAIELGHLGDGSTRGWANDALAEWQKMWSSK